MNSNQAGDNGATFEAFALVLGHGFATRNAEGHVLAVAPVQILGGSAAAAGRLQHEIERHDSLPPRKKQKEEARVLIER